MATEPEVTEQVEATEERPETVNEFMARVAVAQLEAVDLGVELPCIEASEAMIKYFNRKGLNGAKYFIYQGVRVCPTGQSEAIEEEEATPLQEKLHGTAGGVSNL